MFRSSTSERWEVLLSRLSSIRFQRALRPEVIGACAYVGGFALPFEQDIPLIILGLTGLTASLFAFREQGRPPMILPVLIFLAATFLSTVLSVDAVRSIRLSASLLPGTLLFFLIVLFRDIRHIRFLYLTFAVLGLLLGSALLLSAWQNSSLGPDGWIANVGCPILVVSNDITFLAVLAPLSVGLLFLENKSAIRILAIISILSTIGVVGTFQSRTATLTLFFAFGFAVALIRPKLTLVSGVSLVGLVVVTDACLGFPLALKFKPRWDPRIALWLVGLSMFFGAPIFGQGPHTYGLFHLARLKELDLPSWLPADDRLVPWAHNLYIEVIAEQGLVGFAALGFLLISAVFQAWKLRHSEVREVRVLGAATLAALVGFCTGAILELSLLRQWVVIVLFALVGVVSRLSQFQAKQIKEEP